MNGKPSVQHAFIASLSDHEIRAWIATLQRLRVLPTKRAPFVADDSALRAPQVETIVLATEERDAHDDD